MVTQSESKGGLVGFQGKESKGQCRHAPTSQIKHVNREGRNPEKWGEKDQILVSGLERPGRTELDRISRKEEIKITIEKKKIEE